ncbi:MAG: CHASE2 domain-containing protein [Deltaproteobacteria bacterium]|nr:CHASE2 domain-containing protein [Deltaproteobacteria bacterium]
MRLRKHWFSHIVQKGHGIFWLLLVAGLNYSMLLSPLGDEVLGSFAAKVQFMIREWAGVAPSIHPSLKVYAQDDLTLEKMKMTDIPMNMWGDILRKLSKSDPALIMIDKSFADLKGQEDRETLREALRTSAPVVASGFTETYAPRGRKHFIFRDSMMDWARPELDVFKLTDQDPGRAEWLPIRHYEAYGPDQQVSGLFYKIGRSDDESFGKTDLFRRIGYKQVFPHLAVMAAREMKIDHNKFLLNGEWVYTDHNHLTVVNFPSISELRLKVGSIWPLLSKKPEDSKEDKVQKGDIVMILPDFSEGNVDIRESPIGKIPKGYVLISLVNSILTKNWIRPVNAGGLFILAGVLSGAAVGVHFAVAGFWISVTALVLAFFVFGMLLFCFASLAVPWMPAVIAVVSSSLLFFCLKTIRRGRIIRSCMMNLRGLVPPHMVRELAKDPGSLVREASQQMMTVMFLDLVSFSDLAEKESPDIIFDSIRDMQELFIHRIHEHGGILIDQHSANGIVCFFGYSYVGGVRNTEHADQAIACAEAIQNEHVFKSLERVRFGDPMIPLRFGIHSAKVYIGDIGERDQIDFMIVGHAVNFASALKDACEPFNIMISESSMSLASHFGGDSAGIELVSVDFEVQGISARAWHYQPLILKQHLLDEARKAFEDKHESRGRAPRWPINESRQMEIVSTVGRGLVINFSLTGIAMTLFHAVSAGERIRIDSILMQEPGTLNHVSVVKSGLLPVECEVRWAAMRGERTVCGARLIGLSEADRSVLYESLKEIILKN